MSSLAAGTLRSKGGAMPSIRILVVDDHELIRRNMCKLLSTQPDFDVVCEAASGYEAIRKAGEHQPHVVLLDLSIPELNGLMAAPLIKRAAAEAQILIVTSHDNLFFVCEAFRAGAQGFLSKNDLCTELIAAVRQVHARQKFVSIKLRSMADRPGGYLAL
jgi:DNA-binding NarL/FixJ family response regulator